MFSIIFVCMLATSQLVSAKPTCQQKNTEVICTAGKSDYHLQRGLVSDNERVTSITLRACRIVDVELESFEELPALEHLDLSRNKIQTLILGVLDEFKNLKSLNLSYNQLTGFPLGLFDQKPNLLKLDLKGNQINELELGVLDPMTKLTYFDVTNNDLLGRTMNPYIFDQSPHISDIFFSGNDMSGAKDNLLHNFENLNMLDLDTCFLTRIPKFAVAENLNTMTHLKLSSNKITKLDDKTVFVSLGNLKILNLADNAIETIVEDIFMPMKKLSAVILRGNKLTQISDALFRNFPKLINIDLANNLVTFVPVNAFRGSPVKNLNLANNKFSYLTDNFCLELKNSGGMMKKFYFNDNPWQCNCLLDIISEVKKFNIEYNNVKFNGNQPVCVMGERFHCERQPDSNTNFINKYNELILGASDTS